MSAAHKGKKRRKPFGCWAVIQSGPRRDDWVWYTFRSRAEARNECRDVLGWLRKQKSPNSVRVVKLREVED